MSNLQIIALMDCDSFFVSCEQLDNPELLGKPVCVLGNNDGCVISRSKEAKKMGVKMGMPHFMAKKEFPNAIYVSGRYSRYVEISNRIMGLLTTFSPNIEQYSIDEAFIDFTGLRRLYKRNYLEIAKMIRNEVKAKIGIPVSIGISTTKTLAKLASHRAKTQDGVYLIGNRSIEKELKNTPVSDIWGIGKNTTALFAKYGLKTAYEFSQQSDDWIDKKLGIRGLRMKEELLGNSVFKVDNSELLPKSIQNTRSFANFSDDKEFIKNSIIYHINTACRRLREMELKANAITVMLKTKDFKYYSERKILLNPTSWDSDIIQQALLVFEKMYIPKTLYRSSGVTFDSLIKENDIQMSLFANIETEEKKSKLSKSIDKLTHKYKKDVIKIGFSASPQNC